MISKTHKDTYYNIAGKLNLDTELVTKVGDFYWSDIADILGNFKKREVYVYKLGCFRLRKAQCDRYLENMDNIPRMMIGAGRAEEAIQATIERLNWKRDRINELLDEFYKIKEERLKYQEKKDAYRRNLQEQNKDLGGVEEQSI